MAADSTGNLSGAVAEVYAEALLPLARQADQMDLLADELRQVAELLEGQTEFHEAFASPVVPVEWKLRLVEQAFRGRVSDLTCDALGVVTRHGRMGMLRVMAERFRRCVRDARRQVEVTVTAAAPLDPDTRQVVLDRLTRHFGATPVLNECVDPDILGGLLVQAGDEMIDLTLRTELNQITETLARRLSIVTADRENLPGL